MILEYLPQNNVVLEVFSCERSVWCNSQTELELKRFVKVFNSIVYFINKLLILLLERKFEPFEEQVLAHQNAEKFTDLDFGVSEVRSVE